MVSELGGSQISTLLETLPGIANVLRSPVANAIVNLIRAAARLADFNVADADELVHYATRRSLMSNDEGEQLLADVRVAQQKRLDRAADREKAQKEKPKAKPKPAPAAKPAVVKAVAAVTPPKPKATAAAKPAAPPKAAAAKVVKKPAPKPVKKAKGGKH